ncbi:putative ankyrin repeat and SAM domain-containing protein 3 isoform X1 [Apostichopus japonicus]|uniref:Putative ankyrin repeat and SAM domain-containing protein 3 isoform X1 n=1 Tax=Stichopus japonicus TaxID=307972 RepID=A0A2G8L1J5_STIJA|nr:putative ankyrin repeat and SAM domain-containing protein 3 isoform X1 [Apostichopus japonicus]
MRMLPADHLHYQTGRTSKDADIVQPQGNQTVPPASSIGYTPSILPLSSRVEVHPPSEGDTVGQSPVYPFNDLQGLLKSLNLSKYVSVFEEQDVDLRVFLTLTDSDLKEVGIKLMGPRRKMTNAIARWHSEARMFSTDLEQIYADKMETALQEMAVQYQEMSLKKDELAGQLLQEKELRGVVEGCLVEDRKTYQQMLRLVTDTRSLCHRMREMYDHVRFYQSELLKRLKEKEPQSDILLSPENLAENLQIGLILDAQFPPLEGTSFPPVSGLTGPPTSLANMLSQHGGMAYTSSQPITNSDRKGPQDSPTTEQLQMDMKASTRAMNIQNISMEDLMSHLGQMSHQMARVVAKATNNMDQLLEGQTQNFSPNSSGNSLP